jgi:chemotaxis protein methyltransferase CheR
MSLEPLHFFARLIEGETGIVFSETNFFQLKNRLDEIASQLSLDSVEELHSRARTGVSPELKRMLVEAATNNETYFFRDPKIFDTIEKTLLPEIARASGGSKVRVWSAACSNGQEAYSLGMLIKELQLKQPLSAEILATDIAKKTVAKGQSGKYSTLEIERGLPVALKQKYFAPAEDGFWRVRPELGSLVQFKQQNLLESLDAFGKFELILCRNVLIYQRVENKAKIVKSLVRCMKQGGYLILGAGESLIGVSEEVQQVNLGGAFLYQLK